MKILYQRITHQAAVTESLIWNNGDSFAIFSKHSYDGLIPPTYKFEVNHSKMARTDWPDSIFISKENAIKLRNTWLRESEAAFFKIATDYQPNTVGPQAAEQHG